MNTQTGELDAVIQAEIDADTEFQATYAALASDDEKNAALEARKTAIKANKASEFFEEAKKNRQIAEDQKIRAEKAEGRKDKKPDADTTDELPSLGDIYALTEAKVPLQDVPEVQKAAKLLGKSIPEALKDDMVISILKDKAAKRATSDAANIDSKRPGVKGTSDAEILARAAKGEVFAPGSQEAEQLFWARRGGKKS